MTVTEIVELNSRTGRVIREVAQSFDLVPTGIRRCSGGFSGANVFCVECSDGRNRALRMTPLTAALPRQRLVEVHGFLRYLNERGLPEIAAPIRTTQDADTCLEHSGFEWQFDPWKPGAPLDSSNATPQRINAGLELLNRLHRVSAAYPEACRNGSLTNQLAVSPTVEQRLRITRLFETEQLQSIRGLLTHDRPGYVNVALSVVDAAARRLPEVQTRLASLSSQPVAQQPVLRDVWRAHVLFEGHRATGIIDTNTCCTESVVLDLSRLFRSWFGSDNVSIGESIEAYHCLHPLTRQELDLFSAYDGSSVVLSPLIWLRRLLLDRTVPTTPAVMERLSELAQNLINFQWIDLSSSHHTITR